jgi:hypothetical protein
MLDPETMPSQLELSPPSETLIEYKKKKCIGRNTKNRPDGRRDMIYR